MMYSTLNHQKLPFSDPTHPPLWWRNTWMVPDQTAVSECVWVKNLRDESFNISRSFDSKLELSYWVSFAILDEPKYLITLYICWCSFKQTDIVDVSNLNRMSYWWSKHWIYDILQQLHFMDRVYKNTRYYLLNLYIIGWTIIFELSIIIMRRRKKTLCI